jgi:hypothetical protein
MKNIFLLPTDSPSRLWLYKNFDNLLTGLTVGKSKDIHPQNIYITSDKEIKEGEKCITFGSDKCKGQLDTFQSNVMYSRKPHKIILTTDQELIADGVQAIDDDFLEWFVKNPSCESVKVERLDTFKKTNEVYVDEIAGGNYYEIIKQYKIIIPQEETKQETLEGVVLSNGYNKQGYGYRKIMGNNTHWITLFISGGFQMYAYYTDDEEMEKIYDTGVVEKITPKELEVLIRVLVID